MSDHGMHRFEGWTVIVTGAGSGIGKDISRRFTSEGAFVVVADIDASAAQKQAEALGDQARAFAVDVTSAGQVRDLVEFTADWRGGLDVLVNNAGVSHRFENAMELEDSEFDRVLDINTKSLLYTAKAAVPLLRTSAHGSIAITASIGAAGLASAMFSRIERLNSRFSCSTTPIWRRSHAGSIWARSVPSTVTRPACGT